MKKILNIYLLSVLCICLAGCSDDDDVEAGLKVLKSDVAFSSIQGSGSIEVAGEGQVTAISDESWCKVTVSGNIVKVDVTDNNDILGRTAIVTITASNGTAMVGVTQEGLKFSVPVSNLKFKYDGSTSEILVDNTNNLDYEVNLSDESWLHFAIEGNKIIFTADETTTISPRTVSVSIKYTLPGGEPGNERSRTIEVPAVQDVLSYKNLLGTWNFKFNYGLFGLSTRNRNITISQKEDGKSYYFEEFPLSVITGGWNPATEKVELLYNEEDNSIIIYAGQYLGISNSPNYTYICMNIGGSIAWDSSIQMQAVPTYVNNKLTYTFADNGSGGADNVTGVTTYRFSAQPPTVSGAVSAEISTMINLILTKQ